MKDYKNIKAEYIEVGNNTIIEPTAVIRGLDGKASRIVIGDNCYIGANVQIIVDEFSLGDYSKIHHDTNIHGYKPCKIGHNAWVGQFTIIDSIGGVSIGNNCGIGAQSQLWSHIKYGDTLEGCRFKSEQKLEVGDDVWFVGHCIVSPIKAKNKSLALAGSVVTSDMEYNRIYGGAPAKDLTDKVGNQFMEVSLSEKTRKMQEYIVAAGIESSTIEIIQYESEIKSDKISYFIVSSRNYTKRGTPEEIAFMKFLLPDKAKFTPI
ncbi:hypothetical protein SAMN04487910_4438 [Aquimarina amphilecti]|uniref:Transferase hexapeptide (Six repeat-containing protein) n=1 Tax=Aquimarina amphilecti TaxID=1038014 RepID=A0A1H7WH73_AQUAM|nr:hypothetical protein [Aquimarina amphilecti]SEM20694.1 hypothetical protein SAMN04487910_4438 [Aquimarina amphilecti]